MAQRAEKQLDAGIIVEAAKIQDRLKALQRGRGKDCPDAVLHLKVADDEYMRPVSGLPSRLHMETYRPSDAQPLVTAGYLGCQPNAPGAEFNLLTSLARVKSALAGCKETVHLQAEEKYIDVSTSITGPHDITRTVQIPMAVARPPDRLARQVRQLFGPS